MSPILQDHDLEAECELRQRNAGETVEKRRRKRTSSRFICLRPVVEVDQGLVEVIYKKHQ